MRQQQQEITFIQAFRLPPDPIYHYTLFCILWFQEIKKMLFKPTTTTFTLRMFRKNVLLFE